MTSASGLIQGYIDERSPRHVAGWACDLAAPNRRLDCVVMLDGREIARQSADEYRPGLEGYTKGDGRHYFRIRFARPLAAAEAERLEIRAAGAALPLSPYLVSEYTPIDFVAMDIVDNCNLRCPFCVYDYAGVRATHFMAEETLDAALRFLPYATDGNFWFSCLHEPSLHPKLMQFVDKVPAEYRRKIFYTTNLAKRMPPAYFEWLADAGLHNINISIESLRPEVYERMRKGARHRIFLENWNKLIPALRQGKNPTRIRYIAMAYKSNLRELPAMVRHLFDEREAWQVEVRYTLDVAHMPPGFRAAEYLDRDEWTWLRHQLRDFPADRLILSLPPDYVAPPDDAPILEPALAPAAAAPAEPDDDQGPADPPAHTGAEHLLGQPIDFDFPVLPPEVAARHYRGRYAFQVSSNGKLVVSRARREYGVTDDRSHVLLTTHVRNIEDPLAFLDRLPT